jgi:hypothetical protein
VRLFFKKILLVFKVFFEGMGAVFRHIGDIFCTDVAKAAILI